MLSWTYCRRWRDLLAVAFVTAACYTRRLVVRVVSVACGDVHRRCTVHNTARIWDLVRLECRFGNGIVAIACTRKHPVARNSLDGSVDTVSNGWHKEQGRAKH